jgi:hypothetical protein
VLFFVGAGLAPIGVNPKESLLEFKGHFFLCLQGLAGEFVVPIKFSNSCFGIFKNHEHEQT